ncbi:myocardin isoform X1 [Osmerus eperlanus]|uniref:myocardin isoform X1 n=1 Tax=Osmerus eperlanus TaxID=29151 RepID=UPI002E0D203E
MTLLASERSLLIRNKFRSVLQLRIQNRRQQNEINADSGLKSTCPSQKGEKCQSEALRLTDDGATQKSPPGGLNTETAQVRSVCGGQREKKTRLAEDLSEVIHCRQGPLDLLHKHALPLENYPVSFPHTSDVFEDDISSYSSSSSPEQLGVHQSPAFSSSPGLSGDQSLSDLSPLGPPLTHSPTHAQPGLALLPATEGTSQPMSMTVADSNSMATTGRPKGMYLTSQNTPLLPKTALSPSSPSPSSLFSSLLSTRPSRPRKPRDSIPKMRKLKYHQYIPPDQRAGAAGGPAAQKSPVPAQTLDPAYTRLLQQQQVFLQLQILQNQQSQQNQGPQQQNQQSQQNQGPQQQLSLAPSGEANQMVRFHGATPQPVSTVTNPTLVDTGPTHKPELLPANLVDMTVSDLRQQLRKRGLPVSGTKPTLLQRLHPFQLPHTCLTPTPISQLGPSLDPLTPPSLPPTNRSPNSSPGSGPDTPRSPVQQVVYAQPCGLPNGTPGGVPTGIPSGVPNGILNRLPQGMSVSVRGDARGLSGAVFLAPAATPSSSPSPGLPLSSPSPSPSCSSPLQHVAPWRSEREQHQHQHQQELSLELEMRERIRSRPRERASRTGSEACGGPLHLFLQQEPGCPRGKPEDGQTEVLFTQVFCCQPCDVIGQDFELPMQITASPVPAPPSVRSLEEELQEAIQKAQMDPSQSIDDILDEPISCVESLPASKSDLQSPVNCFPVPSPPSQSDQSQPSQRHSKDDNFLSSPLCSSLLLELPPSPATTVTPQAALAPLPPPPLCSSPLPSAVTSRKRRAPSSFDPAEWLETLTSGLRPLSPPVAPFVETDFGLDSDLNVSRVLDLMVEQW